MPKMYNLEIRVKLRRFPKDENAHGYCLALDGPRADRPREFELDINSTIKLRNMLETIAHEMVHVKQYARGELYVGDRGNRFCKNRWQGKWMSDKINYWDLPWEIEAHGREAGLFVRWCEKNKVFDKWTVT